MFGSYIKASEFLVFLVFLILYYYLISTGNSRKFCKRKWQLFFKKVKECMGQPYVKFKVLSIRVIVVDQATKLITYDDRGW